MRHVLDLRARLVADLDETKAWSEDVGAAFEDFLLLVKDADPNDAAEMRRIDDFGRAIDRRRQWIQGRMRRHHHQTRRLMGALAASRAHRTAGFRTAGLRPRRACAGSGRPSGRRMTPSRAGPDPDPDEPEPPPGGSTHALAAVA